MEVFAWSAVREAFGLDWDPSSGANLVQLLNSLQGSSKRVMWRCVGALLWSIWYIRNKITIEAVFPSHPADYLFKTNLFLQQWMPLQKQKEGGLLEMEISKLQQVYHVARSYSSA